MVTALGLSVGPQAWNDGRCWLSAHAERTGRKEGVQAVIMTRKYWGNNSFDLILIANTQTVRKVCIYLFIYLFKDRNSIIETPQGIHHFCLLDRLQFCCQPGSDLGQTWPVHISQVGEMLAKICPKAPFGRTNGYCIRLFSGQYQKIFKQHLSLLNSFMAVVSS